MSVQEKDQDVRDQNGRKRDGGRGGREEKQAVRTRERLGCERSE